MVALPAMPNAKRTARRGITLGRAIGMSTAQAAMAVMSAATAAKTSVAAANACGVGWLDEIHDEAQRLYLACADVAPSIWDMATVKRAPSQELKEYRSNPPKGQ